MVNLVYVRVYSVLHLTRLNKIGYSTDSEAGAGVPVSLVLVWIILNDSQDWKSELIR